MRKYEFKCLLALLVCSDPWPTGDQWEEETLKDYATRQAMRYGFRDWIEAYHFMD
jgi:hypothetical protein